MRTRNSLPAQSPEWSTGLISRYDHDLYWNWRFSDEDYIRSETFFLLFSDLFWSNVIAIRTRRAQKCLGISSWSPRSCRSAWRGPNWSSPARRRLSFATRRLRPSGTQHCEFVILTSHRHHPDPFCLIGFYSFYSPGQYIWLMRCWLAANVTKNNN